MSRIVSLATHRLTLPLSRPFVTAVRRADQLALTLVEAVDDDGKVGWGEAVTSPVTRETPDSVERAVSSLWRGHVLGREPGDADLARRLADPRSGCPATRSAIDCAILDLAAQSRGLSLSRFLGGTATAVRTDMTISVDSPRQVVEQAEHYVSQGFTHLKIKVERDHDPWAVVTAVRRAVGSSVVLRVDANQTWTPDEAIRFILACEDAGHDVDFVEQPVAAHDLDGLAAVRKASGTPIVADESARTPFNVDMIASRGAADIINVKLSKAGGLTGARQVINRARAAALSIMIGCMMESPVGISAAASLAAAVAPDQVHDCDSPLWLATSPLTGGASFLGPVIELPGRPGLGFEGLAGRSR